MTLVEQCDRGLADESLRCGTESFTRILGRSGSSDERDDTQRISGRVTTEQGYGLPGVTLIASRIGPAGDIGVSDSSELRKQTYTRFLAVSAPDGSYAFEELPEGDYTIRNNRHDDFGSRRITVRAGVEYADLVLRRERSLIIEGRVTDDVGRPLSRVSVLPVLVGVPGVRTDRSGRYRLPISISPDAGNLRLRFEAPGYEQTSVAAALPRRNEDTIDQANIEVDAQLAPVEQVLAVTGTVTTRHGRPLAGRSVVLNAANGQQRHRTVTNRAGEFEFPAIGTPQAYELSVAGAPDYADYVSDIRITRDESRFDVVLDTVQSGALRGRIIDTEGAPIADVELRFRSAASTGAEAIVRSDRSGNFVLEDVPAGEATLSSRAMPSFHVRGLTVRPGDESRVEVVLDQGRHELAGTVTDRYGRAVPASRVVLRWAQENDGISSSATRKTATDALGHFRFDRLGPGLHSISVDAPGFATNTFEHDVGRDGYTVTVRLN